MNALLHSPAEIARQMLVDGGLAQDTQLGDWQIWSTNEHDSPDRSITVYDTTGTEDGRVMVTGELQDHFGLQFRIRTDVHPVGALKAKLLRDFISESIRDKWVTVDDQAYVVHSLNRIGNILYLGADAPNSKRRLFTVNATISLSRLL